MAENVRLAFRIDILFGIVDLTTSGFWLLMSYLLSDTLSDLLYRMGKPENTHLGFGIVFLS
jgi:hypothetical protein